MRLEQVTSSNFKTLLALAALALLVGSPGRALAQPTQMTSDDLAELEAGGDGSGDASAVAATDDSGRAVPIRAAYVVATTIDPELDAVAERIGAAARTGLRRVSAADWSSADRRFLGYDEVTAEVVQMCRDAFSRGKAAWDSGDQEGALMGFEEAVMGFDEAAAALEDPIELADALIYYGAALIVNGRERDAHPVFERLQGAFPTIFPDPEIFPAEVLDAWAAAAPRRPRYGVVSVTTDPPGAEVFIDQQARGRTPLDVDDVPRGIHMVRLMLPGHMPFREAVNLRRQSVGVEAMLLPNEGGEELNGIFGALAGAELTNGEGAIADFGGALDVEVIGILRVGYADDGESVSVELGIFDVASGRRLLRAEGQTTRDVGPLERGMAQFTEQAFTAALRPRVVERSSELPPAFVDEDEEEEEGGVVTKWWFWTAVGVGALAIAGGVTAAVLLSGGDEPHGQVVFDFN